MRLLGVALAVALACAPAAADEKSHVSVGAGGWTEPIHTDFGVWGSMELWPPGRWGGRIDAYGVRGTDSLWLEAGVARVLGATRPHIVVSLHGGGGWAFPDEGLLLSAGIASQFGLKLGPLALGLDGTLHALATSDSLRLALTGVVALQATW